MDHSVSLPQLLLPRRYREWSVVRENAPSKIEQISAQFSPTLPIPSDLRSQYHTLVEKQQHVAEQLARRPNRERELARRSASSPGEGYGSEMLSAELALIEAREAADTADAAGGEGRARRVAEAALAALRTSARLAPAAFRPCLTRATKELEGCLFSPSEKDAAGMRMLYKQVLETSMARRLAELEESMHIHEWQLARTGSALGETKTRLAATEAERASEAAKARELANQLQTSHDQVAALRAEVKELGTLNARLVADAESLVEARIGKLQGQLALLEDELEQSRDVEYELELRLEKAVSAETHAQVLAEIARLQDDHTATRVELQVQWAAVHELEEAVARESADAARLRAEAEAWTSTHTPRPPWGSLLERAKADARAAHDAVDSTGSTRRREKLEAVSKAKSSSHNVSALYAALVRANQANDGLRSLVVHDEPHFLGRGYGAAVPKYLHAPKGERLRNWRLPKRDVELCVKAFWKHYYAERKAEADNERARLRLATQDKARDADGSARERESRDRSARPGRGAAPAAAQARDADEEAHVAHQPFADLFDAFLHSYPPAREGMEGLQKSVKEFAFNIVDGCKRYVYDADIELFLEVLSERMPENTHAKQMSMLDALRAAFAEQDAKDNKGMSTGTLRRKSVAPLLRRFFPTRTESQIAALVAALERDHPVAHYGEHVRYGALFAEDRDGNQTMFIELVRDQWLRDPRDFVNQVEAALVMVESEHSTGMVSSAQAAAAISAVDPRKPAAEVRALVAAAFESGGGAPPDFDTTTLAARTFILRLMAQAPTRSGRPPANILREALTPKKKRQSRLSDSSALRSPAPSAASPLSASVRAAAPAPTAPPVPEAALAGGASGGFVAAPAPEAALAGDALGGVVAAPAPAEATRAASGGSIAGGASAGAVAGGAALAAGTPLKAAAAPAAAAAGSPLARARASSGEIPAVQGAPVPLYSGGSATLQTPSALPETPSALLEAQAVQKLIDSPGAAEATPPALPEAPGGGSAAGPADVV